MKNQTIHFKNGHSLDVTEVIVDQIILKISSGEAGFYIYKDSTTDTALVINLEEVLYIQ